MSCHACQKYVLELGWRRAFLSLAGDGEVLQPGYIAGHGHAACKSAAPVQELATCHRLSQTRHWAWLTQHSVHTRPAKLAAVPAKLAVCTSTLSMPLAS